MKLRTIKDDKECKFILLKHGAANIGLCHETKDGMVATQVIEGRIRGVPSYFVGMHFSRFAKKEDNGYVIFYVHQSDASLTEFALLMFRGIKENAAGPLSSFTLKPSSS